METETVPEIDVTFAINETIGTSTVIDSVDFESGNGIDHTTATLVIALLFFIIVSVISLLGNMLVCVVIHRSKRLQSTTNYFVISLAVSDLIYTCAVIPFLVAEMVANEWTSCLATCKIVRFVQYWVPGTVTFVLLCICEDRYYTILYPLSFKITRGRAKHMIFASWISSFVVATPTLYFYNLDTIDFHEYCSSVPFNTDNKIQGVLYITCYLILTYVIPISILIFGYSKIFRYIWRVGFGGRTFQRTTNPVPRPKVKMVKMIMVVNTLLVLLATPFLINQLWFYGQDGGSTEASHRAYIAVTAIFFTAAAAKPVLYMCYNSNFRRGCQEVFCMNAMKCYRGNVYTITTTSKLAKTNHIGIDQDINTLYRTNSPSKTFNRASRLQGSLWPLDHSVPSTYV